jgi:hypothetical protein
LESDVWDVDDVPLVLVAPVDLLVRALLISDST